MKPLERDGVVPNLFGVWTEVTMAKIPVKDLPNQVPGKPPPKELV
jgi:hypothetical protein